MNALRRCLYCFVGLSLTVAAAAQDQPAATATQPANPGATQPATQPTDQPTDTLKLEDVRRRLETFQALEGQDALKEKAVPLLTQTVKYLEEEAAAAARAATYKFDPQKLADDITAAKTELNRPLPDPQQEIARLDTVPELQQELANNKQLLSERRTELEKLDQELKRRDERRQINATELAAVEMRLEKLKTETVKPQENEAAEVTKARQELLTAEQRMLTQQRTALQLELPYYDAASELLSLQKQDLQRKIAYRQRLVDGLGQKLAQKETLQALRVTGEAQKALSNIPRDLQGVASEVAQRAQERSAKDGPLQRSQDINAEFEKVRALLEDVRKQRDNARQRLEDRVIAETVGEIIDQQRSRLPSVYEYREKAVEHTRKVSEARTRKLEVEDALAELSVGLEQRADEIADDAVYVDTPEEREELRDQALDLLQQQRALLTDLNTDYSKLISALQNLAPEEEKLVEEVLGFEEYLNEQSRWVQVSPVFGGQQIRNLPNAVENLLDRAKWEELLEVVVEEFRSNPAVIGALAIAVMLFMVFHTRLKRQLIQYSQEVSGTPLASFRFTWLAFLATLLIALWIPALIAICGAQLVNVETGSSFVPGVGHALIGLAYLLGVLRLTGYVIRPWGLGEIHFRWPKERTQRVRVHLRWFQPLIVPLGFATSLVRRTGDSADRDSLGRLLLFLFLTITSWFLYRVLKPTRPVDERSTQVELTFGQKILTYAPTLIPLFFALLSLAGYTYTAHELSRHLYFSGGVILLLVTINEMSFRWLYIARGKLALEQARKRQEARQAELAAAAAAAEGTEGTVASEIPVDTKGAGVDLSAINLQTRRLLNTTFHLTVFLTLWVIWDDVIPQMGWLNEPVWGTEEIVQAAQAASGETPPPPTAAIPTEDKITYADLILFILASSITIIASRNLPGLLEITVLQSLPLDTGIRYAAGMLARYVVIAVGIVIAFSMLGIGVTQISILLGGLAVGLGFGLQELFANFVSGIMLLFEQPIRIGDIVTIGDVTGTVTRIRIRATTITDWDRKEYIVPNKEFITGQFRNWTLTDTTNRIVIVVGVAYGSDTDLAQRLLLRVCEQQPEILEDPPPTAVFDQFGDSTLNFTVRFFLPTLERRLAVIHNVHTAIDKAFRRAGIEIAFPQRDLHIRTIDRNLAVLPLRGLSDKPSVDDGVPHENA